MICFQKLIMGVSSCLSFMRINLLTLKLIALHLIDDKYYYNLTIACSYILGQYTRAMIYPSFLARFLLILINFILII